ncbi:hypothetical protein F2P81_011640 [Scophthalmus maximus]|uniref:Uncharacterized protein n=1 Tax=Scophthalmus maximus TaxID=52904 RepID=A0A6A4SW75_SCOMX|nr:hypothetical protein F2P81_011640 [Scophthalmus maximus]
MAFACSFFTPPPPTSSIMDSSAVLRQQSQNKIHSDLLRMKNEHNKISVNPQPSKLVFAPHLSKQDSENKDPGRSDMGRKAPVRAAGKVRKKKPCTRPVPFNLSQPKSSTASKNQQPLTVSQSHYGTHAVQPESNECNVRLKTQNINQKPTKHQAVFNSHVDSTHKSQRKATENISQLSGQSGPPSTLKTSATLSNPLSAIHNNTLHQNSAPSAHKPSLNAETCLENMNLLSLKDPTSTLPASKKLTAQVNFSKGSTDKGENFQPDHAAFLSILRNEGVSTTGLGSPTPQSKQYNYTAQRVPIRKNHAEATGGPVAVALKETPLQKWTPQRVRDTRHQPMSAMKWHLPTQQSSYANTPALRSCKTNLQPHQEEVVQRLFDDQEEEQNTNVTDKDPETQTEQLSVQSSSTKPHCEGGVETTSEDEEEREHEQRTAGGPPFFQAPQRESVIFFSTGKKLFRAPRFEKQESSCDPDQHDAVSSEPMSSVSEPTCRTNHSVHSLHRDIIVQKSCGLSPAVALLRKRLPPLEELRMDEEVATYTSVSVATAPGFVPPRPRCGNPLASILHMEESSRFVPIGLDLSSGPSSPQQER